MSHLMQNNHNLNCISSVIFDVKLQSAKIVTEEVEYDQID